MPYSDYQDYVKAMPILKANELLEQITAVSYPHSKPEAQLKTHRALHKQANPSVWDKPKKAVSLADLAKMVKNG